MWIFKVGTDYKIYDASTVLAGTDAPGSWGFTTLDSTPIVATEAYYASSLAEAVVSAARLKATGLPGGSCTKVYPAP